jgi:hypothetical protein
MSETAEAGTAVQVFSGVQRTTFANRDAARSDNVPTYKAKTGVVDRISIVNTIPGEPPTPLVARVHTDFSDNPARKGLGYVICKSTYKRQGEMEIIDKAATCCQHMGESRKRCAALVIKYNANPQTGAPVKPVNFQALVWLFPPDKFENLFTIHEEFAERNEKDEIVVSGLSKVDLIISCEDDKFQKIKIVPSPSRVQSAPQFKEAFGQTLADWEAATLPRLDKVIGREVSDAEILAAVGAAAAGGASHSPTVAAPRPPAEIENLFN